MRIGLSHARVYLVYPVLYASYPLSSAISAYTCACVLSIALSVYYTHLAHVGKLIVPYSACILSQCAYLHLEPV